MRVTKAETEYIRYLASEFGLFDYEDRSIESWLTMPRVLAIRYPDGNLMFFYASRESSTRRCFYKEGDPKSWLREFRWRLMYWLEWKGLYQNEFARRLGISPFSLNKYVNGTMMPSAYVLCKMAEVLKISVDDLVTFDHDINVYDLED